MRCLLVLLCACNQVYGLAETNGPDSDDDGVRDGVDNCTLIANRDQSDVDEDHLGDACDPCVAGPQLAIDDDRDGIDDGCDACPTGSNHDEDGDGFLDGCDVCPGHSDDHTDADGDGVGDACDHAPGVVNARVMFDSFAAPRGGWVTGFGEWTAERDIYTPVVPIPTYRYRGAWHPDGELTAADWAVQTIVTVPAPNTVDTSSLVGIEAATSEGGISGRICGLALDAGVWVVAQSKAPIVVGDVIHVELRERTAPSVTSECFIDGVLVSTRSYLGTLPAYVPMLLAAPGAEYRWVDVIR